MILSPLLLAGTLTAQIPSAAEQLRRIADVTATVRNEYVDELDEAFLAARCIKSMDEHLGERKPQPAPPAPDAKPIERIAEYWRQAAPGDAEGRRALGDACLRGMVNDLDRLTEYLDRGKFNDLRGIAVGGMGGLGLEVEMRDGVLTVVEPLENTPGARCAGATG
jgi:C-terminal processing protease CtpA/Prc